MNLCFIKVPTHSCSGVNINKKGGSICTGWVRI